MKHITIPAKIECLEEVIGFIEEELADIRQYNNGNLYRQRASVQSPGKRRSGHRNRQPPKKHRRTGYFYYEKEHGQFKISV